MIKLYYINGIILCAIDLEHVRDECLMGHEVPSMESLTTRLLWVLLDILLDY